MKLTRAEQETVVNFNEEEDRATVYTYNGRFKKNLRELSGKMPQDCQLTREDKYGGVTYSIPKGWVKIVPPRILTDAQKAEMARRLASNLRRKSSTVIRDSESKGGDIDQ